MQDFRNLKVWEKAHELTLEVYRLTAAFPKSEQYGLSAQMRSSASSIPTNLAEGCGRSGDAELARFSQIAMGSASELEYQCILARDLALIDAATCQTIMTSVIEVKRMLGSLIVSLRSEAKPRRTRAIASSGLTDRQTDRLTD
jgi:four helix bundle protein